MEEEGEKAKEIKDDKKVEKKDDKGGIAKGIFAGIGAALGIAAIGVGGKMLYDKYKKKIMPEKPEENLRNEDTDQVIQKLRKQRSLKPKFANDDFDKNYIRASSGKIEDEEELINIKNSFICPISHIMMVNPVITPYGTTYEESEILKWLEKNNNDFTTKKPLNKEMLVTNFILKAKMREYNESLN